MLQLDNDWVDPREITNCQDRPDEQPPKITVYFHERSMWTPYQFYSGQAREKLLAWLRANEPSLDVAAEE